MSIQQFLYNFNSNFSPPPASGQVRVDTADQSAITKIFFHNVNDSGTDVKPILLSLKVNDRVYLQDQNESQFFVDCKVASVPIDQSTYVEVPVTVTTTGQPLKTQRLIAYLDIANIAPNPLIPTDLVTIPGADNANSYAEVFEADDYNATRPFGTSWAALSTDQKEGALKYAALLLDNSFVWTGAPTTVEQAMCWPRTGMLTRNGFPIDPMLIPKELKMAQSEYARQSAAADITADNEAAKQGLSSVSAGSVSVSFESAKVSGGTATQMDAALQMRTDPAFLYASRFVPDAVRMLLVPSWYLRATVSNSVGPNMIFEAHR